MRTATPPQIIMTNQEIITKLAEFMGYGYDLASEGYVWDPEEDKQVRFNPLKDWNAWRQVEEKVMEDRNLWGKFTEEYEGGGWALRDYMKEDLLTRCKALISILPKE